jgi:uncharacterized protein (DUF952 family)
MIYRITLEDDWQAAQKAGFFASPDLVSDGFIHLSTVDTLLGTASRYYVGHTRLRVLAIDDVALAAALPEALRWELSPSRKVLFPHCFIPLPMKFVVQTAWLERNTAGDWILPVEISSSVPN